MTGPKADSRWPRILALVAVPAGPIAGFFVIWTQLSTPERETLRMIVIENPALVATTLFALVGGLAFAVHWVFRRYIEPLKRLAEDVKLIATTNPSHRTQVAAHGDIARLAENVNEAADRLQGLQNNVAEKVAQAKSEVERERNTLAALIHELTDGVLVCNHDGQILLSNKRAREYLANDQKAEGGNPEIPAIGRSVFGFLDRNLILHATDELALKLRQKDINPLAHFVTAGLSGTLLRVQAIPVADEQSEMGGLIFFISDVTRSIEEDSRRSSLLRALSEDIRNSLTGIRTAAEMLVEYPSMEAEKREHFVGMMHQEVLSLAAHLEKTTSEYSQDLKTRWPLESTRCIDLLQALKQRVEQTLDVQLRIPEIFDERWVQADSHSIVQMLLFLVNEMKRLSGVIEFVCRVGSQETFTYIDLVWRGSILPTVTLREWEDHQLIVQGKGIPATLREVLHRHDAELWSQSDHVQRTSYLRLLLPATAEHATKSVPRIAIAGRPEFYDFDLFNRAGQSTALDDRPLADLTYTAFDTETTGLRPGEGDEIISIGAVRIVNRRLLRGDVFDQLVDPRRPVPKEATAITGITEEMVSGKPTIGSVLPLFNRFVEDSVLVAHNAAFDMRFLQIKEVSTGIRFSNPVLDTLVLSEVVHPNQEDHSLEAIAKRLGVNIIGRHTALGDAIVTGEVFVGLLELLLDKNINTLREAQEASRKTHYARIKY